MYQVFRSKKFEKSLARVKQGGLRKATFVDLEYVIDNISLGNKLDQKYRDHQLLGEYKDYRECHIQGDLLLVYKIERDKLILVLVDIGSHSYLFG